MTDPTTHCSIVGSEIWLNRPHPLIYKRMSYPVTLGIEEEFFLLYRGKPTLSGMGNLSKLLWKNPTFYFSRSASNFTRKEGAKDGWMSALEVSTRVCDSPKALMDDVLERRRDILEVCPNGLIAYAGMVNDDPYNTAGLHIHIGVPRSERRRVYHNLVRFLPVLALASSSSPWRSSLAGIQSQRMHASYALGPLRTDPWFRFQDLIVTRRLGTLEIRVLDPVWDTQRLKSIVEAVWTLANLERPLEGNPETYNRLRTAFPLTGSTPEIMDLALELHDLSGFNVQNIRHTVSDQLAEIKDTREAHRYLDGGFRSGVWIPSRTDDTPPHKLKGLWGMATYYAPRLAYIGWKAWRENLGNADEHWN